MTHNTFNKDERFKSPKDNKDGGNNSPGPGRYPLIQKEWVKRSYNLRFLGDDKNSK